MGYERYNRGGEAPRDTSRDYYGDDRLDRDPYSSARDYAAAGYGANRGGGRGYADHDSFDGRASGYYGREQANDRGASQRYGGYGERGSIPSEPYRGSYAHDGHRFNDVEDYGREYRRESNRGHGRSPLGSGQHERGFLDRAGDEVRSWFGDEEAERRREADARADRDRDADYRGWRSGQMAALDRDYDEYRRENRSKFEREFATWRTDRQTQRNALNSVTEHMDVVGSDGSHVGTVDKVRGDRIVLTKSDQDAGGRHHSIPSRWIDQVDDKVTLRKTADEAKREWRDEERNQAFFSEGRNRTVDDDSGGRLLDRSFSGTY